MIKRVWIVGWVCVFGLAACGGGGGGSNSGPVVSVSLSQAKARVGEPVVLQWTSNGANSCTGQDSLSGTLATSGSISVTASVGGQLRYSVQCSGPSGVSTGSATLVVPLPVFSTSYENKNNILLDDPKLPFPRNVGIVPEAGEMTIFNERAVAFADFLQEGELSAITVSNFYKNAYPGSNPGKWPDSPAKIYMLKKTVDGQWHDVTDQLIKDAQSRYICVSPGFLEIADINNDKKPDVVFGCTGPDFLINGVWDDSSEQYVLLSQPDGSYKVNKLPIGSIYVHQAALADVDGDGNVDILSVDPKKYKTPIVLFGNGDGTFRLDATKFPADMLGKAIYGIRAVPVAGKLNVIVSGMPPGLNAVIDPANYGTKVLQYVNGSFQYVQDMTAGIPRVARTGLVYGLALDVVYHSGFYYFMRVDDEYAGSAIIKVDASTGNGVIVDEYVRGSKSDTSGILKLTSQAYLIMQRTDCDAFQIANMDAFFHNECVRSVFVGK